MKTEAATSRAKEVEQRAALAEQEQQALAAQAKEKVEAAKQAAEQQREAELAKAKEEAAKQAAEQQREAKLAKAKDEAANKAAEQQRMAELAKAKEEAAKQEAEQQRLAEQAKVKEKPSKGIKAVEERDFEIAPGVKIRMCWIPPGEFVMGSPSGESGRKDDEAQHRVTLSEMQRISGPFFAYFRERISASNWAGVW
jgi:formylglycine-generating enzyme required for sulfatase activity